MFVCLLRTQRRVGGWLRDESIWEQRRGDKCQGKAVRGSRVSAEMFSLLEEEAREAGGGRGPDRSGMMGRKPGGRVKSGYPGDGKRDLGSSRGTFLFVT